MSGERAVARSYELKIDLDARLKSGLPIRLELGCGETRRPGAIGVDIKDLPTVDIVADLDQGLPFLPDNSVDDIRAISILEHLSNFEFMMEEIHRVLRPNGRLEVFVPHFSNPYQYSDFTHRRYFGLYTFDYFVQRDHQLGRKVPDYYFDFHFRVQSLTLEFGSSNMALNLLKRFFAKIINRSRKLQELYEENLVYLMPCYAIKVILIPVK